MKTNIFMKGYWENLIIRTFECEASVLERYLPNHVELDLYHGKALFSMVAFTFSKVRFFGIKIPLLQSFGEINFRCYVKSKIDGTKGVVFIKELAPKPLIAFVANAIYNEPFYYKNIKKKLFKTQNYSNITYEFKIGQAQHKIYALMKNTVEKLKANTLQEFVVDRYIAFVKNHFNKTMTYKICHKPWQVFKVLKIDMSNQLLFLLPKPFWNAKEVATYVVDGSSITIEKGVLQHKKQLVTI
jgi:uncharacterized protein YqjF (DUF2071 family)